MSAENIHGTAVAINGAAVLLLGQSGSGKSDLALRLIDRGAKLISDDQVLLSVDVDKLWAGVAPNIAGMIEMRGFGIIELPYQETAQLKLVVDLDRNAERFPDPLPTRMIDGFAVPEICLAAFESSAPVKIEQALKWLLDRGIEPVRKADGKG